MSIFRTMNDDIHEINYNNLSLQEKSRLLQALYDKGHDVRSMSKKFNVTNSHIRSKITAHRGRSVATASKPT
jgi:transposase-like protein